MSEPTTTNTIIIGAGAAGLACGACLKQKGIPFILLDQKRTIGEEWRNRYDRLHLHTPKQHSALPYFKIPSRYPKYLSKNEYAEYLKQYADALDLKPSFNQKVTSVKREKEKYEVWTENKKFISDSVIIASGYARKALMPSSDQYINFKGEVIHSTDYKNGERFRNKKVLVVGFGNSACEIAICLHEHNASPSLSVRGAVNIIPREIAGIPIVSLAIVQQGITKISPQLTDLMNKPVLHLIYGNLQKLGLTKLPYGPITQITKFKKIPLLDIGTFKLIRENKIKIFPGIKAINTDEVEFTNGTKQHFDAIIFATGYQPAVRDFVVDLQGTSDDDLIHNGNHTSSNLRNLYLCGYNVAPTGMLREMGIQAKKIAEAISKAT